MQILKQTIVCPSCNHQQEEPKKAMSTNCRGCGVYLRIEEGVVKVPSAPSCEPRYSKPFDFNRIEEEVVDNSSRDKAFNPANSTTGSVPIEKRQLECFECGGISSVSIFAHSTQCEHCSAHIRLENLQIDGEWTREIKTRGNVVVGKKGKVSGVTVTCNNLTVHGAISGPIKVDGTAEFQTKGILTIAQLDAQKLVVGRKTELRVTRGSLLRQLHLGGILRSNVTCKGHVLLTENALLEGALAMESFHADPGAKHVGSLTTLPKSDSSALSA